MAVYYNRVNKIFVEVTDTEENREMLDYYGYDPVSILTLKMKNLPYIILEFLTISHQDNEGYVYENKVAELITELDITNGYGVWGTWSKHIWVNSGIKKIETIDDISTYLNTLQVIINIGRLTCCSVEDSSKRLIPVTGDSIRYSYKDTLVYNQYYQIFARYESRFEENLKGYSFDNNGCIDKNNETKQIRIPSYKITYSSIHYDAFGETLAITNPNPVSVTFLPYISFVILFYLRKMGIDLENNDFYSIKFQYDETISKLEQLNNYDGLYHLNYQYQLYDAREKDLEEFLKSIVEEINLKKPQKRNRTYRIRRA